MENENQKLKYKEGNIEFSGISQPPITTGTKITGGEYPIDNEGENITYNRPIINAIDIDWNNAKIPGVNNNISSSADLLQIISDVKLQANENTGNNYSLPIYDSETETQLRENNLLPNKYISLNNNNYNINENPSLLYNLLTVINNLQQEVNKLKNTFKQGIYSYNGEATYMSNVVGQYGDDEEPLWAIDESELDEIENLQFDYENNTTFVDSDHILKDCEDNRMFVYVTADSSDINILFKDTTDEHNISINLSDFVECEKCNILVIISRKPEEKNYPNNYIYIVLTDYFNNTNLLNGYLNDSNQLITSEYTLNHNYYFNTISLGENNNWEKFNIYSQNKILGSEVIESTVDDPNESTYRVAHIAVRTVKNYDVITKIKQQLVNGEFIVDEQTEKLYLKINNKIIKIGADTGGNTDPDTPEEDTMENYEIIKALSEQGLLSITFKNNSLVQDNAKYDPNNIESYKINDIGSIRFVHEDTGKVYEYSTNAYGELESKLIEDSTTLAEKLNGAIMYDDFKSSRGFVGQLGLNIAKNEGKTLKQNGDYGLYADRIKIGAIYGPLKTDVTYGCSHAFIELENTSNIDFNLDGCQLHYIKKSETSNYYIKYSLKLKGIIPAGGTFLIRGKKYIENDQDANCFIHVNTFDQEWYVNGELLDLTMDNTVIDNKKIAGAYVLILSYHGNVKTNNGFIDFLNENDMLYKLGLEINETTISENLSLGSYLGEYNDGTISANTNGNLHLKGPNDGTTYIGTILCQDDNDKTQSNAPYVYPKGLIDALAFNVARFDISSAFDALKPNTICRNTFELDPAKQAFNSLTMRDSSRNRWEKKGTDYQYLNLNKQYIEFPKSSETRDVDYYTPKASFEHKNVITDKTRFNKEKPNAVTVSYGENVYTTRCFNWLSASNNDEYVWIYDSEGNQLGIFESYKYTASDIAQKETYPRRKEFPANINNIVYCDYRVNDVIDRENKNKDVTYKKYATAKRACGLFAGSNDFFVSHKCIVDIVSESVNSKTTYSYIVGQADKHKKPLEGHCSEKRYFTLYPDTYTPVIYQITDQQGFHWIEYQVWAAAAESLNQKIMNDMESADIMPIIINTGDATQSGSRVNEWLDYFNAGDCLFNHFEQNNIVGNNDLNGTDIQVLGTGDDPGKSNAYYYYLFNCNEVNNFFIDNNNNAHYPIVNNTYVPSLYYLDVNNFRLVMVNSEITPINCRDWFNLRCQPYEGDTNEYTINIYTGFNLVGTNKTMPEKYMANEFGFTPLYTLLWHAFPANKKCIVACHEMPFTVITNACCSETDQLQRFRSMSNATTAKLIGSHLNQLQPTEEGAGVYWFSRLLESKGVKLCIGGHKHTYAISYPIREYYKYYKKLTGNDVTKYNGLYNDNASEGDIKLVSSKEFGPMEMEETLVSEERPTLNDYKVLWKWQASAPENNRNIEYPWCQGGQKTEKTDLYLAGDKTTSEITDVINWSKLPLTYMEHNINVSELLKDKFYPATPIYKNNGVYDGYENNAVTYIMCQATGYKLTSNKELPTPTQKFSKIIPVTQNNDTGDTADNNQKFPMYIKYIINKDGDIVKCKTYLARAKNIFNTAYKFTQQNYGTNPIVWTYLIDKDLYDNNGNYDDLDIVTKYDNENIDVVKDNIINKLDDYDNYGLWVTNEREMIPEIQL